MNKVLKHDIWFATLPKAVPGNRVLSEPRPVIILSDETVNPNCPLVTVVPLSSRLDKPQDPTCVLITANKSSHLDCNSRAQMTNITAIDKSLLRWRIGRVENAFERLALQHALAVHLGLGA